MEDWSRRSQTGYFPKKHDSIKCDLFLLPAPGFEPSSSRTNDSLLNSSTTLPPLAYTILYQFIFLIISQWSRLAYKNFPVFLTKILSFCFCFHLSKFFTFLQFFLQFYLFKGTKEANLRGLACSWMLLNRPRADAWWFISVGNYCHMLNSNQLVQLSFCRWSFIRNNLQADLNSLAWIQVIQSIETIWNVCIIWHFSSVNN